MKKLMTMIGAAVAAFGLYADGPVDLFEKNEVDFTADEPGAYAFPADPITSAQYWYKSGEAEGTVKEGDPNFLELDAEAPVYRAAAAVDVTPAQVAIAGAERGGIIFDQKVKFSAFDIDTVVPDGLDAEGAKIAVWVKTIQEEASEDPAINHLMITAGNLDIMLTPDKDTPFVTKELTTENIDVNKFYQLTITAIEAGTVGGKVIPGFKVALDGEDIALAEGLFPADPSVGGGTYSAEGADLIKVNKLFPSLVKYSLDNAGTLQGVAFKGTGAVESISIQPTTFAPPTYDITITAPENGTLETSVTNGVAAGTEVTVTATPDKGYEFVSITTNGQVLAGNTFVMPAENVTVAATFKASESDPTVIDPDDPSLDGKTAGEVFKKIPDALKPVNASKFAAWCQKDGNKELVGEGGADAMLDAFLLDCLNDTDVIDEAKKAFVIESIEYDALTEEWIVLVKGEDAETTAYKNGYVQIIPAEELADAAEEGVAEFFRAKLVAEPVE